jgi:rubrerythrin
MLAARTQLIRLLQLAYSGELAAAHAYRGHSESVRDRVEAEEIRHIEEEEHHHRLLVGGLLKQLDSGPDPHRERRLDRIGRTLGFLCHFTGWFLPMYGAGRLESKNVKEYEDAARFALESGATEMIDCLLTMAEVEWEHERYFRRKVESHWLGRIIPLWAAPPPKETIRSRFQQRTTESAAAPLSAIS